MSTQAPPVCPVHGLLMREWKPGNFSCPQFLGQGVQGANQAGYCNERVGPPKQGGGKSFGRSPEEQRAIAAQSCFSSACSRFAGTQASVNEIVVLAMAGFGFVMQCAAKTSAPAAQPGPTGPITPPVARFDGQNFPGDEPGDPGPWATR